MNWIRLFENFREQPLEKEDIEYFISGKGINWTKIEERVYVYNDYPRLSWFVYSNNTYEWIYSAPKNYILINKPFYLIFVWDHPVDDTDLLLSKIHPNWKEIKNYISEFFDKLETEKIGNNITYHLKGKKVFHKSFINKHLNFKSWFLDILNEKFKINDYIEEILLIMVKDKFGINGYKIFEIKE